MTTAGYSMKFRGFVCSPVDRGSICASQLGLRKKKDTERHRCWWQACLIAAVFTIMWFWHIHFNVEFLAYDVKGIKSHHGGKEWVEMIVAGKLDRKETEKTEESGMGIAFKGLLGIIYFQSRPAFQRLDGLHMILFSNICVYMNKYTHAITINKKRL